ncbi:MAG TPA: ABC transporter permease [Acidimicrobiales bacterium]
MTTKDDAGRSARRADGGVARLGLPDLGPVAFLAPLVGLIAVQRILFPAPLGIVLNGALVGGRIALIALGIALVYRANRVVNFAQGDLGAVPATLAVMLVLAWDFNYWLGLAAGVAAAVVLGVVVETLIIARFFRAPRLVLTVATIGVAQLLTGAALLLPRAFGDPAAFGTRLPQPFDARFEVEGTIFNANDIFTMVVVPLAFVALGLFLHKTNVGVAIVAAAERADRAATLGIPVRRLHTVVWVIASVLAFLAMFLRAGAVGLPIGEVLAPTFLVQALAAAVFGRFERLTTIAAAAIGLGIVDQAMTFQDGSNPATNDAVLFVIVLVGLLVTRPTGTGRVDSDASATWQATREVRPIPRELVRLPEVRLGRAALWAVVGVFVVTLPMWMSTSRLNLATIIVLFGIVAASLVVLTGWAGQVSLGQMAFVGVGAAVGGALTDKHGFDLFLAIAVAGAVGAVAAVVVGYPALRRRGLTLAVSTLAFALFVSSYLLDRTIWGDDLPGRRIDRGTFLWSIDLTNETRFFYLSLGFLALALAMVVGVRRTRTGRVLIAIRENERAARSYGVNASRTTLAAFALSGFLAAMAGALFVHQQTGLSTDPYLTQRSLDLFSMVVIGGLGSLPGALLGAVYVRGADFFLPLDWQFLATGTGLLLVLLLFPSGLGGVLADLRDGALRRVAVRRGLVVPSLLADVRVEEEDQEHAVTHAAEAAEEVDAEAEAEPVDATPVEAGADAEPVDATPVDAERVEAGADAEPADAEADATPVDAEPVDARAPSSNGTRPGASTPAGPPGEAPGSVAEVNR